MENMPAGYDHQVYNDKILLGLVEPGRCVDIPPCYVSPWLNVHNGDLQAQSCQQQVTLRRNRAIPESFRPFNDAAYLKSVGK
jgi:hypothetical protein